MSSHPQALAPEIGDRYFEVNAPGVIFYTTAATLELDTTSCRLPVGAGGIP